MMTTVITHPPIIRCWPTGGRQIGVLGQQVNLLAKKKKKKKKYGKRGGKRAESGERVAQRPSPS